MRKQCVNAMLVDIVIL